MSPDVKLFNVNMAETSTAEETEIRDALDKGSDVVDKLAKLFLDYGDPTLSRNKILDYLNKKLLKLTDLDFDEMSTKVAAKIGETQGVNGEKKAKAILQKMKIKDANGDLESFLPGSSVKQGLNEATWRSKYENMVIKVEPKK
jgi:hypothetical protein